MLRIFGAFKSAYVFNYDTLSYDKIELTLRQKVVRISLATLSFLVFMMILSYGIFVYFYDTESYQSMKQENKHLKKQYEVLNNRLENITANLEEIEERDDSLYRVILQKDPVPQSVREVGYGGSERYKNLKGYNNSNLIVETARKLDKLSRKLEVQSNSYKKVFELAKERRKKIKHTPAIRPVDKSKTYITSHYGYRFHPIFKKRKMHEGVDFSGPIGTKIRATAKGKVVDVSYSGGYGRSVLVDHGFGYKTKYAHLNKIHVKKGERVDRGEEIGLLGNSGLSTGPHLHYEVRKDNSIENPINYYFNDVTPEEYLEIVRTAEKQKEELQDTKS